MNNFSSRLVVLCFAVLLLSFASLKAQDLDTVSISGAVIDQNAALIPGAVIELTVLGTNKKRTVSSGDDGSFRIIQLEPGTYSINVVAAGFAAVQLDPLSLLSGQNRRLTIELLPETVATETVVITSGDTPVIDMRKTIVGNTIAAKESEALPLASRSILDVVLTLPGVTEEPLSTRELAEDRNSSPNQTPEEAGTVGLAGAPAYSNNFTIDGLDNNDDRAARERFQP